MKYINTRVKIRHKPELDYYSVWSDLITQRVSLGETVPKSLPADECEFYDVGLGTKCNLECDFCYTSAKENGKNWDNIVNLWKSWISTKSPDKQVTLEDYKKDEYLQAIINNPTGRKEKQLKLRIVQAMKDPSAGLWYTEKPFQIAIGSTGEPTVHPQFIEFLEAAYESGVVPNYTTNGVILANDNTETAKKILEATRNFCGGVAVSFSNKSVRDIARKAIDNLSKEGDCKVMIHHIISDHQSVDEFITECLRYGDQIHYHVLLPLMKHGRSLKGMEDEVYLYLGSKITEHGIRNIALGANFTPFMKKFPGIISGIEDYPLDTYSKNILMKDNNIVITPSSFNLKPILTI